MSDDSRAWAEIDKVRVNVHDLRNRVAELGVYFQESRDDVKELSDVVRRLTDKVDVFVGTVTTVVTAHAAHAEACFREKSREREVTDRHHEENKERLDRLEGAAVKFLWAVVGVAFTALAGVGLNIAKLVIG